ncbi:MAG: ankyrin repeat domain-containing protein [Rickettsiales bacterium]|nr:ankyrin repeat domain-containing protein [Pseudomonadota bacterium]MDA0966654.1 ankyrin repeat domain-containing protein [Pseudomonadota bacterium]MDG4543682.1 ankyrin repeat domain-containing protein [Rickettsiales bacterium]MDG4545829.1 ankyrin repeat domain-containing protein [Rickettsiales bacterium]MDG4547397.1 ankyrin repeat domain-containing protein [Rickettsiales bacterium]
MQRQNQLPSRANTYQDITLYQSSVVENSIDAWVDDIAVNSGSKGLSMAAFKAVSDRQAYETKELQSEMKSNNIFESVKALRDIYTDENPAEKFRMNNVNPSEIRAVINKYINSTGKLKAHEAELARRNEPIQRAFGVEFASAPPAEDEISAKPAANQNLQVPLEPPVMLPAKKDKPKSKDLYEAAENNDLEGIKGFLKSGVNVNKRFYRDYETYSESDLTPLHGAARNNNAEAIELLLKNGANLHVGSTRTRNDGTKFEGITPLHLAAIHNSADAINALAAQGANLHAGRTATFINGEKREGTTPLHEAAQNNKVNAINALAAQGANLNIGETIFSKGEKIEGITPLHGAAMNNSADAINALAAQGANLHAGITKTENNCKKIEGTTPLHEAAKNNKIDAINALATQGANLNIGRTVTLNNGEKLEGTTPLHEAAMVNSADAINALATQGANLNAKDNKGYTPLSFAVFQEQIDAAVQIKKAGGELGNSEQCLPKLNRMLTDTIEQRGVTDTDKIRDLFFIGAEMPDLQGMAIAPKTMLKEIYQQAKQIPIERPNRDREQEPVRQPTGFAQAENARRQVQNNQAECCVIM